MSSIDEFGTAPRLPVIPADFPEDGDGEWGKSPPTADEHKLLEGPQNRGSEFIRIVRIALEFVRGFRRLHFVGPCVTVFGSARFTEGHPYYKLGRQVGAAIVKEGFTVMTGGGPGLMEAANRGAKEARGHSVGCNIELPEEQQPNPYLDTFVQFRYFFVRKVMLVKYSHGFVVLPGGFGTMDEIFETATLIQTGKIPSFPLILMGTEYWRPLFEMLRGTMLPHGTVEAADIDRLQLTDSPEVAIAAVERYANEVAGLRLAPRRRRILGEKELDGDRLPRRGEG